MPKRTQILSLGTRKDATTWENGCRGLGFNSIAPVKKSIPSMDELTEYFKGSPNWIYFGGHFGDLTLANKQRAPEVEIRFDDDTVALTVDREKKQLKKNTGDFQLHMNCDVVLWGGCSVCSDAETVRTLRKLFGRHVFLGFAGLTGWRIVDAMLGGGFIGQGRHFFDRVRGHDDDPVKIRDAWMKTAQFGYGGGKNEFKFRAFDPDGQEWILKEKKITRGRRID